MPKDLKIKEINSSDAWDRYVLNHEHSGYGHLYNWKWVIRDAYHLNSNYFAAIEGDSKTNERICGILPLYRFKKGLGRSTLVSIPFFDTGGILARGKRSEIALFEKGHALLSNGGIWALELRQDALLKWSDMEIPGAISSVYGEKVSLHLDLPESQQKMMATFKSKLRSQIRKGQKNGLTWKIGKKELLDPFYEVFSRNMRDLGSPVHSKDFFNAIFTHFYHHGFICIVFYRSHPVAASFMFRFKNRLSNPWASSIREFRHLNSNMFLYWQMIRFACNIGMEIFDMGRSSKGASTYRFKTQWQPKETPLYWYRWIFPQKRMKAISETLTIDSWKKLPVPIANLVGPIIRKKISL